MPETPPPLPTPVLNYDPRVPARTSWRLRDHLVLLLICSVLGALAGMFVLPHLFNRYYTATGYLIVVPNSPTAAVNLAALQTQQNAHVTAITAPTNITAGVMAASMNGVTLTSGNVISHLQVNAVPESKLIVVTFSSDRPAVATGVVNAVMNSYAAATPTIRIVSTATIAPQSTGKFAFIIVGLLLGLAIGAVLTAARPRRR